MKNRLLKTFTSLVLTVLMVLSIMPAFAITIGAEGGGTYKLVTDVSQLAVGDKVIIVAKDSAVAMSTTQNTKNRGQTTVTKTDDTIANISTAVQVFTLEQGTVDGTFAFQTGSGYIYAASSSKNHLKTKTTKDANSSWKITIADGVTTIKAQGSYTRNLLKYNSTNSLFSCYGSGQQDVSIYVKTTEGGSGGSGGGDQSCQHSNTEERGRKEPTCTEVGYEAGTYCNECQTYTLGGAEIPATGHSGGTATCTDLKTCDVCGEKYGELAAHNYVNGECTVCHEKQPTTLTINRGSFPNNVSAYDWYNWSAAATTGETITGSGFIFGTTTSSIQMNPGKGGALIYNTDALPGKIVSIKLTATLEGTTKEYRDFYVLTSDTAFTQDAPSTADATAKNVTTAGATWEFTTSDRYFAILVTGGAAYLSSIEITYAVCYHTNKTAIGEAKDATCTEDGNTAGEKCADCGKILKAQEPIPATGHKDADKDYTCDVCDAQLCTEHNWVGGEIIKTPTCTETGLQAQYCSICKQPNTEDKVLDMIDHTPETDAAIEPTCTSTGLTEGSHCSVCKTVIVEQTVLDMIDHNYVDNKCTFCGDIIVQGSQLGVFQFGKNDSAGHKDGTEITTSKSYESGNYTLTLTSLSKVYGGAFDAKGNSALKLGTSSAASLSFTVNSDVNTVVIYIAGYKANTAKIDINGTTYTITSKSNEGNYTKVVVDTTTNKTVTLKTLKGGYRAMIDSIEFWGYAPVVKSFSLSLNEGVTVKVTINIPEAWLNANKNKDAKVVFFSNGEPIGEPINVVLGTYTYSVDLTPKQINDDLTVKIQLADGSGYGATNNVSVSAYKAKVEAAYASEKLSYSKEKYDALIALLDAALKYSSVADGTHTGTMEEHTFEGVDASSITHKNDAAKLFTGVSGTLGTDASIRITVNPENVIKNDTIVLTVGETEIFRGNIADYITSENQIVITGLYPQHFNDTITIKANTEGSSATFSFNSYLKAIYENSSDTAVTAVKNLAVATHLYGIAAEEYLAAPQQ